LSLRGRKTARVTRGVLFLVGGKDGRNEDRKLLDRFVRLCGGASARLLVITSATATPERHRKEYGKAFSKSGVREVSVVHPEDRTAADDPELLAFLERADGVYLTGGSQRRVVGALSGTRFEKRLRERHRKGLTVGGTSAGASAVSKIMMAEGRGDSLELSKGFDLLRDVIVDQHFRERNRLSRLVAAVMLHPALLGLGLDERTAVQIDPSGRVEVFGSGTVTVVEGSRRNGVRIYVMTEGKRYELATRRVKPPR
jgi:cyanophycinase